MNKNLYEILGVAKNATKDEIKKAYKKLAMQFHPDKNPNNKEAEEKFKEISHAADILLDDEKRSKYDRFGSTDSNQFNPDDMVNDLFSQFFKQRKRQNDEIEPIVLKHKISIKDYYLKKEQKISFKRKEICEICEGSRFKKDANKQQCATCKGTGQINISMGFIRTTQTCFDCNGAGLIFNKKDKCANCSGNGFKIKNKELKIVVPQKFHQENDEYLLIREEGHQLKVKGDLLLDIEIVNDEFLFIENDKLFIEIPISFSQAALGHKIKIPLINKSIEFSIPEGTQTGSVFRLKDLGFNNESLFVRIKVETPTKLTKDQIKLLKELEKFK
jgi:molecular chaperone DnaJ